RVPERSLSRPARRSGPPGRPEPMMGVLTSVLEVAAGFLGLLLVAEFVARLALGRRAYYVWSPGGRLRLHPDPEIFPELERVVRFQARSDGERGDSAPGSRRGRDRIPAAGGRTGGRARRRLRLASREGVRLEAAHAGPGRALASLAPTRVAPGARRGTLGPVDRPRPCDAGGGAGCQDLGPRPEHAARSFREEPAPGPGLRARVRGSRRGGAPAVVRRPVHRRAAPPPVARRRREGP